MAFQEALLAYYRLEGMAGFSLVEVEKLIDLAKRWALYSGLQTWDYRDRIALWNLVVG